VAPRPPAARRARARCTDASAPLSPAAAPSCAAGWPWSPARARGSAAVAAALAARGASVVLGAPDQLAIARVARGVQARGGRALAIGTDLGDPDGVARLTDEALAAFGRLDIAVNAPARSRGLDDLAEPDCRAVYFAVRHQLPAIAGCGGGVIVNVALGPLGWSDDARCVAGLTRASALEHAGSGVRINALARGPGSRGFADAACWLCSDAARELNGAVVSGPAGAKDRAVVRVGPPGGAAA
jgi:NAD(P)-dependent dehydrogenase (short-subunit alcohol dehydrogenase family)